MKQFSDPDRPIRTCIGCRTRRPQAAMVRCVLAADGVARVDRTAPGRGAWLCSVECFEVAVRRRAFDRAWRTKVQPEQLVHLGGQLRDGTRESGARLAEDEERLIAEWRRTSGYTN